MRYVTGVPADQFWELIQYMTIHRPIYTHQRQTRADRQRAVGAGRLPVCRSRCAPRWS